MAKMNLIKILLLYVISLVYLSACDSCPIIELSVVEEMITKKPILRKEAYDVFKQAYEPIRDHHNKMKRKIDNDVKFSSLFDGTSADTEDGKWGMLISLVKEPTHKQ